MNTHAYAGPFVRGTIYLYLYPKRTKTNENSGWCIEQLHTEADAKSCRYEENTRSSADADNRLDAFSGQSRSTNMVPFHM